MQAVKANVVFALCTAVVLFSCRRSHAQTADTAHLIDQARQSISEALIWEIYWKGLDQFPDYQAGREIPVKMATVKTPEHDSVILAALSDVRRQMILRHDEQRGHLVIVSTVFSPYESNIESIEGMISNEAMSEVVWEGDSELVLPSAQLEPTAVRERSLPPEVKQLLEAMDRSLSQGVGPACQPTNVTATVPYFSILRPVVHIVLEGWCHTDPGVFMMTFYKGEWIVLTGPRSIGPDAADPIWRRIALRVKEAKALVHDVRLPNSTQLPAPAR